MDPDLLMQPRMDSSLIDEEDEFDDDESVSKGKNRKKYYRVCL
jgi:hypothetical protein